MEASEDTASVERAELRRRIEEVEAELRRYRRDEALLVQTLMSATRHAVVVRESARRESELVLRKARAEASKRLAESERARREGDSEALRLRQIAEETRQGLTQFLSAALVKLQIDSADQEAADEEAAGSETTTVSGQELESALDERVKSASESETASETASGVIPDGEPAPG